MLTTGQRLERLDIADFIDATYSYAINAPESRVQARNGFLDYIHDRKIENADNTDQPFGQVALSMMDELDAFVL